MKELICSLLIGRILATCNFYNRHRVSLIYINFECCRVYINFECFIYLCILFVLTDYFIFYSSCSVERFVVY